MKVTCPICKGSGRLPITQEPRAETHGEQTIGGCPTCYGKEKIANKKKKEE